MCIRDSIGTVKLPRWIRQHTGNKDLHFEFTSGTEFPVDLSPYNLIIHCGGCTLNEREMQYRLKCAEDQGVPITNYGTAIAHLKGVLAVSYTHLDVYKRQGKSYCYIQDMRDHVSRTCKHYLYSKKCRCNKKK